MNFRAIFFRNILLQMIKHRIIGEFGDKGLYFFLLIWKFKRVLKYADIWLELT